MTGQLFGTNIYANISLCAGGRNVPRETRNCAARSKLGVLAGVMFLTQVAGAQAVTILLRLQHSTAELAIDENRQTPGRNIWDVARQNEPQDVWNYPNSATCLVVFNDGKYMFEKRDERKLGRPKSTLAEGVLSGDDLHQLRALLNEEELKKITSPKSPTLPADTEAIREIDRWDARIERAEGEQHFTLVKERVKTGALVSATSGASSGADTYLDNGTPYRKTLSPLVRWFDELGKRTKSSLKESKSQYCGAMNTD